MNKPPVKRPPVVGDTVKLKSGGPSMTIGAVGVPLRSKNDKDGILCVWFTADGIEQSASFAPQTLRLEKN